MEETTIIQFKIKAPNNMKESEINTMILAMHDVRNMLEDDYAYKDETWTEIFNNNLDAIITQAELLKMKKI